MTQAARSRTIAGLIGPLLAAIGLSLLARPRAFAAMASELPADAALVYLSGAIILVVGVAIARAHNVWTGWPAIVTAFGWLAVGGGLARMLFPRELAEAAVLMVQSTPALMAGGAVALALGAFLTWVSFRRAG